MTEREYPSIFNDVIGPVMRGPSSSHCAAAVRIGRMVRDLMGTEIDKVLIEFDPNGSLATTHESQGSDMGLFGGLLGWDATDERLPQSTAAIAAAGIEIEIRINSYGASHPNTYKFTLRGPEGVHRMVAISTGGGMIEITEIDDVPLSMKGDYFETLIYLDDRASAAKQYLDETIEADYVILHHSGAQTLIQVKAQAFLPAQVKQGLRSEHGASRIREISPVLPVMSRRGIRVPFITSAEMLEYQPDQDLALWELAAIYESIRGDISRDQVFQKMREIVCLMQDSILAGIEGTEYADRILGYQSGLFRTQMESGQLLDAGVLNQIILYVTSMMEVKSSMGVIVAAPTAGACGGLPGACIGAAAAMGLSVDEMTKAMLAAGMIGVLISAHATFAAEIGGCQAECGAGSGMAAAALVTLAGGTVRQAIDASSMALQNILGMICDPVANRVEVPCLGKNVLAASNALACANMALAGYDVVIPLDEVIATMDQVGKSLPHELRCTAMGGLSVTATSKQIEARLRQRSITGAQE